MRAVTVTGRLRAPVEHVYDFLLDNRNDALWCPMVSDVELIEGEPGVGAVYRYQQSQGPGRPSMTAFMRTTTADRPHELAWDNGGRGLPYEASIRLGHRGGKTVIKHTNRVALPSRAQQLAWFTIANIVLRLQLRNLRRELER